MSDDDTDGTDGTDAEEHGDVDAVDVFSMLGNDVRLEILLALYGSRGQRSLPFARLYEVVDVGDTSRFNYHLGVLTPHFVSKEADEYALTPAGRRLARAVTAETYTESPLIDPVDVEGRCYACGTHSLAARYAEEAFSIDCTDCETEVLRVHVPPTVVRERDPETVADAFERWSMHQVRQACAGLCPDCGGPVEPGVSDELSDRIAFDVAATYDCLVCGRFVLTSFGAIASHHPTVRSFHRDRGAALRDRRLWEIEQFVGGEYTDIDRRDPLTVRVTFHAGGDTCHVSIGEDLEVRRIDIVRGGDD